MFPSKSMVDYMSEMQRLFPRNEHEDPSTPFNLPYHSPYQSALYNRSSSSTDSTSPESYPDVSFLSAELSKPQEIPKSMHEPTYTIRRQRAIVGRKILGNSQQTPNLMSPVEKIDMDFNFWQHEDRLPETPPGSSSQSKSLLYGLFPPENLECKTPIKSDSIPSDFSLYLANKSPTTSKTPPFVRNSHLSPTFSSWSCRSQGGSNQSNAPSLLSPTWSMSSQSSSITPQRPGSSFSSNFSNLRHTSKYPNFGASSSMDEIAPTKMCTFCRKNGETPIVYMTHCVKEKVGNKNVVTCPILRSHKCATCGASGDDAHTITYCPVLRNSNNGKPLQSTTITLKNTRIKSNGRRRY